MNENNDSILKSVSDFFNSSDTYSEFRMRIDISGIDENESMTALKNMPWIKKLSRWYSLKDFTFKSLFDRRSNMMRKWNGVNPTIPVLPYFIGKVVDTETFTPKMKISAMINGKNVDMFACPPLHELEDKQFLIDFDWDAELINILMTEIGHPSNFLRIPNV